MKFIGSVAAPLTTLRENSSFSVKWERFRSSKHLCTKTHSRGESEPAPARQAGGMSVENSDPPDRIAMLRIDLLDCHPPIWREIEVPV
jgi:hypothetical protein